MSVMDKIESLSSKPEKLMDENTMYYALLKMFLLYYFISLNFKLVGDCWKIFSYNLKLKYIFLSIMFFKDKIFLISFREKN